MCAVDFTVRLWLLHPFSQEITSSMTLRGREYYTVEDDSQSIHGQTQTHHALCNMVLDTMNTPCYNEASKAVLLILIRAPRTARLSIWSLSNFDSAKYNNILNQARWVSLKSLSAYREGKCDCIVSDGIFLRCPSFFSPDSWLSQKAQ